MSDKTRVECSLHAHFLVINWPQKAGNFKKRDLQVIKLWKKKILAGI